MSFPPQYSREWRMRSFYRTTKPKNKKQEPQHQLVWPLTEDYLATPESLSEAGFYYTQSASKSDATDDVKCFICDLDLGGWEEEDEPHYEHTKRVDSTNCAWAISVCSIRGDLTRGPKQQRWEFKTPDRVPTSKLLVEARRKTFGTFWPHDHNSKPGSKITSRKLAEAGFVFTPVDVSPDSATCPYCVCSLGEWEPDDDPMELHRKRFPNCPVVTARPYGVVEEGLGTLKRVPTSSGKTTSRKGSTRKPPVVEPQEDVTLPIVPESVEPVAAPTSKRGRKTRNTVAKPAEVIEATVEIELEVEPQSAVPPPKKGKGKKSVAPKKATRAKKGELVKEFEVNETDSDAPPVTEDEPEPKPTKTRQSRTTVREPSTSGTGPLRLGRSRSISIQPRPANPKASSRTALKQVVDTDLQDELALPASLPEKKSAGRSRKTVTALPSAATPDFEEDVAMHESLEEELPPPPTSKAKPKGKVGKAKAKKITEELSKSVIKDPTPDPRPAKPTSNTAPPAESFEPLSDVLPSATARAPSKPRAKSKKEAAAKVKIAPVQVLSEPGGSSDRDDPKTETDPESTGHESQITSEAEEPRDAPNATPKVSVRRTDEPKSQSTRASDASATPRQALRAIVKPVTDFTQEELKMTLEQYVNVQMQREATKLRADGEQVIANFVTEAEETRKRLIDYLNG